MNFKIYRDPPKSGALFDENSAPHVPRNRLKWSTTPSFINIWVRMHGHEVLDYGLVSVGIYSKELVFSTKESCDAFDDWMDRFKIMFKMNDNLYVSKPEDGKMVGYHVGDHDQFHTRKETPTGLTDIDEDRITILKVCRCPVLRMSNGWLFEDEHDAIMFKLSRK